jgi:pilus assembly protein CpaB
MSRSIKSRKTLGIICVAVAVLLVFVLILMPDAEKGAGSSVRAYFAGENILKGEKITEDKVRERQIGEDVFSKSELPSEVIGKFARGDIPAGDILLSDKIADTRPAGGYISILDGTRVAISLSIKSFAYGVSGSLRAGDVVSVYASAANNTVSIAPATIPADDDQENPSSLPAYSSESDITAPPELRYMYVLAVTDEDGTDIDTHELMAKESDVSIGETDTWSAATVTLLATPLQAEKLASLEVNGIVQFALVYRGDENITQEFLVKQDQYLTELAQAEDAKGEKTEGDANVDRSE